MHEQAHHQIPRLHLQVAAKCNTRCRYCEREIAPDAPSVVAPGLSAKLLSPDEALAKTLGFLDQWGKNSVVVIAGPGEPLANGETLETLRLIRREYPALTLCVCTNGLTLPDHCRELRELAVQHLTVTINGFDPEVVARIQPTVNREGRVYLGTRAAEVLIHNQKAGLQAAVESGMVVKVNCVVVPEINGAHVVSTARRVKDLGAHVFNPVPLIPRGLLRDLNRPDDQYMARLRSLCSRFIPVFSHCKQCRADAEGIPGKEAPSGSFPQISTDDHFQPSSETHLWLFRGQWRWAPRGLQTRWPGLANREEVRFPLPPPDETTFVQCGKRHLPAVLVTKLFPWHAGHSRRAPEGDVHEHRKSDSGGQACHRTRCRTRDTAKPGLRREFEAQPHGGTARCKYVDQERNSRNGRKSTDDVYFGKDMVVTDVPCASAPMIAQYSDGLFAWAVTGAGNWVFGRDEEEPVSIGIGELIDLPQPKRYGKTQ